MLAEIAFDHLPDGVFNVVTGGAPVGEPLGSHPAIELVNDSDFGLGACLRTNDARLAKRFFEEIQAGTIWINDPLTDQYGGPFGGMKLSGNVRELG